jgi:hypothetical protein
MVDVKNKGKEQSEPSLHSSIIGQRSIHLDMLSKIFQRVLPLCHLKIHEIHNYLYIIIEERIR